MDKTVIARHDRMPNLILSLLAGGEMSSYDIQREAGKKNVSTDTVKENLKKMVKMGVIFKEVKRKGNHSYKVRVYKKVDKIFCAWGCLCIPRPVALFPCEFFFDCNYTGLPGEICKKMEWAIAAMGIQREAVTRVFPSEVKHVED